MTRTDTAIQLIKGVLVLCVGAFTLYGTGYGTGNADAAEIRCDQLGANCVCSEPFMMTGFTQSGPTSFWNPTDSITKECGYEVAAHPISRNSQDVQATSDATALSRLPVGNTVARFMRAAPGNSGIFFAGGDINTAALGSTFNARMAIRGYTYYSDDYNFRDDTPACHSKFLQGSPGSWHWENFTGGIHMYDFVGSNWGPASAFPRDCCNGAPGAQVLMTKAAWRGHWFRFEAVVTNRSGPGLRHILYLKDVTRGVTQLNNGVEFVASDWYGTDNGINPWTAAFNTVITSSPSSRPMTINLYREIGTGQCNGWRGVSHMMIAGWDTDAGQRIGAATEIEGGGSSDITPPLAPTNLRISMLP